ncbi:MAG: type II toxin-antitoxin system VapC family toxin [Thermodesulfobacteriota bacterium]
MKLTLDSSVIAKLFIDEKDTKNAVSLMEKSIEDGAELIASDLILYEVGNTIWKHIRKKKTDGQEYIRQLFFLNIDYLPPNQDTACQTIALAQEQDITYYDAVHVMPAKNNETPLVTEDKELLEKVDSAINIKEALGLLENS